MKIFFLIVCAAFLQACSNAAKLVDMPPSVNLLAPDYHIGAGDTLSVSVWKSPELSNTVIVRPDGKISVPLLGDVVAAGRKSEDLSGALMKGFEKYVRNPQVTVIVTSPTSGAYLRRVRITGAVVQPMSLNYSQGMTVLDLVLESGGLSVFAKGNGTLLYRKVDEAMKVFPIYANDILEKGQLESNYTLAPGDIVTVPERSI